MNKRLTNLYGFSFFIFFICSCVSVDLPEEYLKDKEVVYLKQKPTLKPIHYAPMQVSPYQFDIPYKFDKTAHILANKNSLSFLKRVNPQQDYQIYMEIKELLLNLEQGKLFLESIKAAVLLAESIPKPYPLKKGKLIEKLSNATKYYYPPIKGAYLFIFKNGDYQVDFSDGSTWIYSKKGYFLNDPSGKTIYSVNSQGTYSLNQDKVLFSLKKEGSFYYQENKTRLDYTLSPSPQYSLTSPSLPGKEFLFLDKNHQVIGYTLLRSNKMRYDYFSNTKQVIISKGQDAFFINSDYSKMEMKFDPSKGETGEILTLYLPEGIRFQGFQEDQPYADITPQLPEHYLMKKVGPFRFFYTKPDEKYLKKLNPKRLKQIPNILRQKLGIISAKGGDIILPPNLKSYCKLYAKKKKSLISWYPSGFQTKGIIVMWPPSLPRYESPDGDQYFWEHEFYEILLHEYTHLTAGEVSGLVVDIPVWLNEGMAIYMESTLAPDISTYWSAIFQLGYQKNQLLSWDKIAKKATGELPLKQARYHYAQSWKMVHYLIKHYGKKKLHSFLASFRQPPNQKNRLSLNQWKNKFNQAYGMSWENQLVSFYDSVDLLETPYGVNER